MYRSTIGAPAWLMAVLCSLGLQATELPERLGPWQAIERKTYAGQSLYDHIDGGAEVYFEYGFSRVEVGYYGHDEKEIQVEVYRMASSQAAAWIYSFFRKPDAEPLPPPHLGKQYESYLECLNGDEFIRMVAYDSLGPEELLGLLRHLVPEPAVPETIEFSRVLPEKRIAGSEILFNGPIALKNFCSLGQKNLFGVGSRTRAFGCLVELNGQAYRWVTLTGKTDQLAMDCERFLTYQSRNDYAVFQREHYAFLKDQLSGDNMAMVEKGDRIYFLFDVEDEKNLGELFRVIY